ncbi:endonuclease-reverse transcriptase [Labeo rohita]|uniref:Endonuclease-reverse transcriptase n=1 Tax=Labeo rohita TaxID=84645 RepID=A0A498LVF0_LABRO|nr:endonuclease-reverse transcriptase [Labeo rohita]
MVRADKQAFMDNLATQAEDAADRGEQGTLFRITKALSGKHHGSASAPPIKDKQGRLLTTENEQEARWAEHFQEVLNRPPPEEEADIQDASADLDINTDPPGKEEIVTAIRSLKNRKAPGYDNLNAELFKADPDLAATILQPLFRTIWERKQVPHDWNKGIIVKIPKKGALSDCNNWRGITLLSVPSKILAKVIIQRISDAVDKSLRNEQAGFRRGRGCIDQIFALRNIIEQCTEWQRQLYINFVDFERAFDSIHDRRWSKKHPMDTLLFS